MNNLNFDDLNENIDKDMEEIQAITRVIAEKIKDEKSISDENKESIAYRMAEIMTAAKNLYTQMLPIFTNDDSKEEAFDILSKFRLHYINLCDIIQEFDEMFMNSIVPEEGAEYINPEDIDEDEIREEVGNECDCGDDCDCEDCHCEHDHKHEEKHECKCKGKKK